MQKKSSRLYVACILIVTFLLVMITLAGFLSSRAQAAVGIRKTVNFQGKVVNTNGTNVADASYSFRFRIYTSTAPTDATNSCSANSCMWEETKNITTVNGIFQTELGDTTTLPGSVDFNSDTLYLAVKFTTDTEMSPRIRLAAVPYAFNADNLDGLSAAAFVQLTPGSAQSGTIDVTGNIKSGGILQGNTVDAATSAALDIGTTNATVINLNENTTVASGKSLTANGTVLLQNSADSATAFQVRNLGNKQLLTADTTSGQVLLGHAGASGLDGKLVFNNASNAFTVTLQTGVTSASYSMTLPTAIGSTGQCLAAGTVAASNVPLTFTTCGAGSASTLQDAYTASGTASPQILLSSTNGGIEINDAATPIGASLFAIQNNAATATYLGVSASTVTLQDSSGNNAIVIDSATAHLKVYENITTPVRYADIYYDTVANEAVFTASSGTTRVGGGSGNITISLTNASDLLQFTKTVTLAGAYSSNDYTITRAITAGANALTGSVLKVESTSSGSSTVASNILWLNENNTGATGNLIVATTGGAGNDKFKVSVAGTVTLAAGQSYTGAGAIQVTAGAGTALTLTSNAAATWGTSAGALTIQAGAANMFVLNSSTAQITVGTSDTTGTLLVLDTKTGSGDPTGADGGMYYNSNAKKMRCYAGGSWQDCLTAMSARLTGDQTSSVTALANVTDLTFPTLASTDYEFRCTLVFQSAATTTGIKIAWNGPASPTSITGTFSGMGTAAGAWGGSVTRAYDTTVPANGTATTETINVNTIGVFTGIFRNGTTAGNLVLRLASEIAASQVTLKAGSYCEVKPIN